MPVTVDKLLGTELLHKHKVSDLSDIESTYLKLDASNDPLTGELDVADNAIIMQDSNGGRWKLTIETDGALKTIQITTPPPGTPIGLSLILTYS